MTEQKTIDEIIHVLSRDGMRIPLRTLAETIYNVTKRALTPDPLPKTEWKWGKYPLDYEKGQLGENINGAWFLDSGSWRIVRAICATNLPDDVSLTPKIMAELQLTREVWDKHLTLDITTKGYLSICKLHEMRARLTAHLEKERGNE